MYKPILKNEKIRSKERRQSLQKVYNQSERKYKSIQKADIISLPTR